MTDHVCTPGAVSNSTPSPRTGRCEVLGNQITELCSYINAATYRLLEMIREFDQEELWGIHGACSCAHWLNWKCGIGMNAAREKVRVANALGELPKISDSFSRGEISYSKVRAMTRVATVDNEDYLLMIARHGTAYHMETLVRKYRRVTRLQEDDAERQHGGRALHFHYEEDGTVVIHARLPAEQGALVLKALECALDQDRGEEDGLTEGSVSAETSRRAVRDGDTFPQRRADALVDMAASFLTHGPAASGDDRYQVILHVSAETLTNDAQDTCHVEGGFECGRNSVGEVEFLDRNGALMVPTGRFPSVPPSIDLTEQMRNMLEGMRIDADTCVTRYDGFGIDWNMAVEGLMS